MSRRNLLHGGAIGMAGGAALLFGCGGDSGGNGTGGGALDSDAPPEVSRIRLGQNYIACMAPLLLAEAHLRDEGFSEVEYVTSEGGDYAFVEDIGAGVIDMGYYFVPWLAYGVDQGESVVMLAPGNIGCAQVIATHEVRDVADLRGRRVGIVVRDPHPGDFAFAASVLQYIGLTPGIDFDFVEITRGELLTALGSKVDAIFCAVPVQFTLRDSAQGHLILDTLTDEPWRQTLCCVAFANRDFAERNPAATLRGLRGILKGVEQAAREPERAAQLFVERGWLTSRAYAERTLDEVGLEAAPSFDTEDAIRFYSLRLREAGQIESTPEEIISRGTDWRFFDALRDEFAGSAAFSAWCGPGTGGSGLGGRTISSPAG